MEDNILKIKQIMEEQLARVERMKANNTPTDFAALDKIIIGAAAGDGIGPVIMKSARAVLEKLLADEIASGKIEIRDIEGLTIENRVEKMQAVPDDVLEHIKQCHVLLKGPTTTPGKGDGLPNIESANVTLRRELDLFANVRPVTVPEKNIDWIFYRENTEGEYALGSRGIDISDEISMDFKVTTDAGTKRLARAAFEYAKNNGNLNVSIITKANIMKKTDGKFLSLCYEMAKEYPEIKTDDWYVDICAANLINDQINSNFNVFILPNLYGDIITDEAAQIQGGVGTAGSANIGNRYAMFEAIHGSAPDIAGLGIANPIATILSVAMMLRFSLNQPEAANAIEAAVNKILLTHRTPDIYTEGTTKVSCSEMGDLICDLI